MWRLKKIIYSIIFDVKFSKSLYGNKAVTHWSLSLKIKKTPCLVYPFFTHQKEINLIIVLSFLEFYALLIY